MNGEFRVWVVEFGDRENFQLQWKDPRSGRLKTKSSGIKKGGKRARQDAERKAADLAAELRLGFSDGREIAWKAFRERYETEVTLGQSPNTASKAMTAFNRFEAVVKVNYVSEVTPERISYFVSQLRKQKLAEASIASYLRTLKAALRWAARMRMIRAAPCIDMPKRAATKMKGRPLTAEEFERMLTQVEATLLDPLKSRDDGKESRRQPEHLKERRRAQARAASPAWERLLRGLWLSGLRLSEAINLTWDREDKLRVDLTGRRPMLWIPAHLDKGHKNRLLPITPDFAAFLLETPTEAREGRVFPGIPTSREQVSKTIGRIGRKALVKSETKPDGTPRFATAHDLRRTFGERWASRVMPAELQQLMRHEHISTTMTFYVGRNAERTADAVWEAYERSAPNTLPNTALGDRSSDRSPSERNSLQD